MKFNMNIDKVPFTMKCVNEILPRGYHHCFISALTPNTHIVSHYGPTNKKLRFHFPILGCEGASLRAGETTVQLEEGKGYVFDDSFNHEAWHNGKQTRVILIADFWHPDLTDKEVKFLSFLMNVSINRIN